MLYGFWENLVLLKSDKRVPISSFATMMVDRQQFNAIKGVISLQFCFVR